MSRAKQQTVPSDRPSLGGPSGHSLANFPEEGYQDMDTPLTDDVVEDLLLGFERRKALLSLIYSRCSLEHREGFAKPCRVWQGPNSGEGRGGKYGRFSFSGCTASVHRTVWALCFGPIPPKKQIDHECEVRGCCEPSHLKMVTHKKNQKLKKGRKP